MIATSRCVSGATLAALVLSLAIPSWAQAQGQGQYVYPARGQGAARQASDETECASWARRKTGFDPASSAPPPVAPDTKVTGSGARVAGAAGGALIAGVAGGNAGTGALVGAVGGGLTKRALAHREARRQNEAIAQQRGAGQAAFDQARAACLTGRGYTVR